MISNIRVKQQQAQIHSSANCFHWPLKGENILRLGAMFRLVLIVSLSLVLAASAAVQRPQQQNHPGKNKFPFFFHHFISLREPSARSFRIRVLLVCPPSFFLFLSRTVDRRCIHSTRVYVMNDSAVVGRASSSSSSSSPFLSLLFPPAN